MPTIVLTENVNGQKVEYSKPWTNYQLFSKFFNDSVDALSFDIYDIWMTPTS